MHESLHEDWKRQHYKDLDQEAADLQQQVRQLHTHPDPLVGLAGIMCVVCVCAYWCVRGCVGVGVGMCVTIGFKSC